MAYVIAQPCIGVKDTACVTVCPCDCIHPKADEAGFAQARSTVHRSGPLHPLPPVCRRMPGFRGVR